MREKTCFQCHRTLSILNFYRHPKMADGHLGKCKECARKYASHSYRAKAGDAEWVERERCRGRDKYHRLYGNGPNWQSPKGTPEQKRAAMVALGNAVRDGRIVKPKRCGDCGTGGTRIHGHHEDYSKPLAVHWVCPLCHRKRHAIYPERVKGKK